MGSGTIREGVAERACFREKTAHRAPAALVEAQAASAGVAAVAGLVRGAGIGGCSGLRQPDAEKTHRTEEYNGYTYFTFRIADGSVRWKRTLRFWMPALPCSAG